MKKIMPFILIAMIVGGALFFLNDDYEKERYDPIVTTNTESSFWEATFFLENGEEGEYELGVQLQSKIDEWDIEAVEFFFYSPYGGLNYQDFELANFDGEIIYSEPCSYCSFDKEQTEIFEDIYADIIINWKENGTIRRDSMHVILNWHEKITD